MWLCWYSFTLVLHYNLTFYFLNLFGCFWFCVSAVFFPFGLHSDGPAQTEFCFSLTYACYCIVHLKDDCDPSKYSAFWGLKKGAKKLQHILFSKCYCSLRPEWSFLYLEIFMKSSALCRAGLCFALWQENDLNLFTPVFQAFLVLWASSILTPIVLSLVIERKSFLLRLFPYLLPKKEGVYKEQVCVATGRKGFDDILNIHIIKSRESSFLWCPESWFQYTILLQAN